MQIDLFVTPAGVSNKDTQDCGVVVIDILRAGTTICYALTNGCKGVIPAMTIERAVKLAHTLFEPTTLLCGERNGVKQDGFNLGNSPLEYTADKVKDLTLIYTTTNGTEAIEKSTAGRWIIVGGFVNFNCVISYIKNKLPEKLAIVCGGKEHRFALEDVVSGGMIIHALNEHFNRELQLTDSARMAVAVYSQYADNILGMLKNCEHGRFLQSIGLEADLEICSRVDAIPVLPVYKKGIITINR